MSELIRQILKTNENFVKQSLSQGGFDDVSKYPRRHLAVLTCMDTRLLNFLEPAMGLVRGDAKIIKVAGLMVAVYELHVHEIIVMGHDDCGMLHTTADSLCRHMVEEGIDEKAIDAIRPKLAQWADPVTDVDTSVCDTVRRLRANPYLPKSLTIYGMVIHPHTGEIRVVDDGEDQK